MYINYHLKYLKYKQKYLDIKQRGGAAPAPTKRGRDEPITLDTIMELDTQKIVRDYFDDRDKSNLSGADKKSKANFDEDLDKEYSPHFAPDITTLKGKQPINHRRIKGILKKNGKTIPDDGHDVIPLLKDCLIESIKKANKEDSEFLVSIGVIITNLDSDNFRNKGLTKIYIPSCVTSIGNNAFANNQLTEVTIPRTVISIGERAFEINQLTKVTIPEGIKIIHNFTFSHNKLTEVTLPSSLTTIDYQAFQFNKLTTITIPDNVIKIGNSAFCNNELTTIIIPNKVEIIGDYAFCNNKLLTVYLPSSLRSIETDIFFNNPNITVSIPHDLIDVIKRKLKSKYSSKIVVR
jgi:hypothetical protein